MARLSRARAASRLVRRPRSASTRTSTVRPLIIGNWKMRLRTAEAEALARAVVRPRLRPGVEVVLCPSFPALVPVRGVVVGSGVHLGAQDLSPFRPGAYTGDVSAEDLVSLTCRYVIVGHSERRRQGESDETIRRKVFAAIGHGLTPILCVGESAEERRLGRHRHVVSRQVHQALHNVPPPRHHQSIVIAYEPIWAISPGGPAAPIDALTQAQVIHQALVDVLGERVASSATRVIYGGSVDASNIRSFIDGEFMTGALVGADSLVVEDFRALIAAVGKG